MKDKINNFKDPKNRPIDCSDEYLNDDDLDPDIILSRLATGARKPKDEREQKWLDSINDTRAKIMDFKLPFN